MKTAKSKKRIKLLIILLVAAVLVGVLAFVLLNAYKTPFRNMEKTYEKGNVDYMMEALAPFVDIFSQALGEDADVQFRTSFEKKVDEISKECGGGLKVDTDIIRVDKLGEAQTAVFIDRIEEYCEIELAPGTIEDVRVVEIKMTAQGDKGSKELENGAFYVAKYNGKWGIIWIDNLGE